MISIDPKFKDNTPESRYQYRGLCGNYNGIKDDDFIMLNNIPTDDVTTFAESWNIGCQNPAPIEPPEDPIPAEDVGSILLSFFVILQIIVHCIKII